MVNAFLLFYVHQTIFTAFAAICVNIEPMSVGSVIPEFNCFLNGINLPRVTALKTGLCKILG